MLCTSPPGAWPLLSWPASCTAPGALPGARVQRKQLLEEVIKCKTWQTQGPAKHGQCWLGGRGTTAGEHPAQGGLGLPMCIYGDGLLKQSVYNLGPRYQPEEGQRVAGDPKTGAQPALSRGVGWAPQPGRRSRGRRGSGVVQDGAACLAAWRSASRDPGIATAGVFHHGPGTPAARRSRCVTHCQTFSI